MPDERKDSIREGTHSPNASPSGRRAAKRKREEAAHAPPMGGGVGGTSDADRPADAAGYEAARRARESEEEGE